MKPHLPILLRQALMSCFSFAIAYSMGSGSCAAANLTLGSDKTLTIDYADAASIPDLANGTLQLNGDTLLTLSNCGSGDGKTYTLVSGVLSLRDVTGNPIILDDTNNAISAYFDANQPGTGFWADSVLVLTADGTLQLVRHDKAVQNAVTITTRQTSGADYNYYKGVSFANLTYTTSDAAQGGAIDGGIHSTITLRNNGAVTFSTNKVDSTTGYVYGGAISGGDSSTITLSDNGAVTFSGNTASSSYRNACGGAISGGESSTITLSDNESVTFWGNKATRTVFEEFASPSVYGGAIYGGDSSTITLSNNRTVFFSRNEVEVIATITSSYGKGGAIYGERVNGITLENNGTVTFSENKVNSSVVDGGAIYGTGTLRNNGSVTFIGNAAIAYSGEARGGAISGGDSGTITLSNNGSVTFSGNKACSSSDSAYGGAIYGIDSPLMLSNNGAVTFSGNTASSSYRNAFGGAIYLADNKTLSIQNNTSVLFAGNYCLTGDDLRLESIYVPAGYGDVRVYFSAPSGGKIEFQDRLYIDMSDAATSVFHLNDRFTDADNHEIAQTGDIIFTGAYATAENLNAILQQHGKTPNLTDESEAVRLSRTSEIRGTAHLWDGRLIIRDGAIWSGGSSPASSSIRVHPSVSGSTSVVPTLWLDNGGLSAVSVSVAGGAALRLAGCNSTSATAFTLADAASLMVDVSSAHASTAALTLTSGSLTLEGTLNFILSREEILNDGTRYMLIQGVAAPTGWSSDKVTVSGTEGWAVCFDDLQWVDDTLWLYYDSRPDLVTATWNNQSRDGLWNVSSSVNWNQNGIGYEYQDGVKVVFGDDGSGTVTLVGDIAPSSVLVNSSQDYTWKADATEGGKLTGSMTLTKQGSGSLTINTANDYTGGTRIEGGTLVAGHNKALGVGDVTVSNATLDLNRFTIDNKVALQGNSTLGYADGASHIELSRGAVANFRDGYTLSSGKVLSVAGAARYTGTLTLGGGTLELSELLTVQGDVVFSAGTQTTLDLSGWSGTGGGAVLEVIGNISGYTEGCLLLTGHTGELNFDSSTGTLTLVSTSAGAFSPSLNRNQQMVYGAIKDIMSSGNPGGLLGALGSEVMGTNDESRLKQLLDELGGAEYATLLSGQQEAARAHMGRLRAAMGSGYLLSGEMLRAHIETYSHRSKVDGDAHGRGYEQNEYGGQVALEFLGQDSLSGGFALAAGRSDLRPDGGMKQKSDNAYVDAFLMHRGGAYTAKFSLGVGLHQYDLSRRVAGYAAEADATGSSVNFMHESAWELKLDEAHSVQLIGAVESTLNRMESFRETGAGTASLHVEGQDAWVTTLSVGARYRYSFAAVEAAPAASLSLQTGVELDLGDTDNEVLVSFSGARRNGFTQSSAKRDAFGYNVGIGLHVPVSSAAALYACGDAVLRGDSYEVNANVGLQLAF